MNALSILSLKFKPIARSIVCCLFSVRLLLGIPATQAMDFTFDPFKGKPTQGVILANGDIERGDDEKLHRFVGALPASTILTGIGLNSNGGNLSEGVKLATTIRNTSLTTAAIGTCASACFLMFAAGTSRLADPGARIGAHSASLQGVETTESQAVTTQMARAAADFGVPSGIIGRMVTTPASDMAWLTPAELRSMNVVLMDASETSYLPGSPLRPGSAAPAAPAPAPVAPLSLLPAANEQTVSPGSVPAAEVSENFLAGRKARVDYEAWFNGLSGEIRVGAEWWAGVRSQAQRNHLNCETGASLWVIGCKQAQTMLTPSDNRRRADPEFRVGWNTL